MRRYYRHAAFERQGEDSGISIIRPYYWQSVFTPSVGEQRQLCLGHSFPELREALVIAIYVLAIWQTLHHHRSSSDAPIQFRKRIGPGRMNRNSRQELLVISRQLEDIIVRDVKGAFVL